MKIFNWQKKLLNQKNLLKIIIWELDENYDKYCNNIYAEVLKGNICITGIVVEKILYKYDGISCFPPDMADAADYDYVIYTSMESRKKAIHSGIPEESLLPVEIFFIPNFNFRKYEEIYRNKITIISNHCWGGVAYQRLLLPFRSPTINLWISPSDYLKFLKDLRYYMQAPVEFVKERNEDGPPKGKIDNIVLNFEHYSSFQEAEECWYRRRERVNYENLFIEFTCFPDDVPYLREFDELKIAGSKKIAFCGVKTKYDFVFDICHPTKGTIVEGQAFSDFVIDSIRKNKQNHVDLLRLLCGEKDFLRGLQR